VEVVWGLPRSNAGCGKFLRERLHDLLSEHEKPRGHLSGFGYSDVFMIGLSVHIDEALDVFVIEFHTMSVVALLQARKGLLYGA